MKIKLTRHRECTTGNNANVAWRSVTVIGFVWWLIEISVTYDILSIHISCG